MRRFLFIVALTLICGVCSGKTYVLAVGINDYKHIPDLRYCEADVDSFALVMKAQKAEVFIIQGKMATKSNILLSLRTIADLVDNGDMLVFFFSGHGYRGGFCPYDIKDSRGGLTHKEVYAIMKSSKAGHRIVFADACMSGGLRNGKGRGGNESLASGEVMFFLASRDNESSVEMPKLKNGNFTYYLNKGLRGYADINRDRIVTAKELFAYVSERVKQQSNNRQHPVMWGKFRDDMIIAQWNSPYLSSPYFLKT